MSDPVAWSIAIVAILGAFSTACVNVIIAMKTSKKLDQTNAFVADKLDTAAESQQEIHTLVNSNLTEIKRQLAEALEANTRLREEAAQRESHIEKPNGEVE